ncbi:MAG: thioredoxin family protein [Candidatus Omnitrophica bacterium]|nr:thioredoxin family protein [Candidatus Omnitrophota bacterium]
MALLESILIPLGTKMPDFILKTPSGEEYEGVTVFGKNGLLVGFLCNHCPYAKAVWPRFVRLAEYAQKIGINAVAINPNINPDYPEDSPEQMVKKIKEWDIRFPYLVDQTQDVTRAFKAQCTPDIYLFDKQRELVYHGRVDDNWQDEAKVKKEDLKKALELCAKGQRIDRNQKPSMGCSIKWLNA